MIVHTGEGKFLGSKCIAVMGTFRAIGKPKVVTWSRLNATATLGQRVVTVRDRVNWNVGDKIVVSPTGYFGANGKLWSESGGGMEQHVITKIVTSSLGSVITLASKLNQTHLCSIMHGEYFCGAVGVLSRNVVIKSADSETPGTQSFGFGGHIAVIDLIAGVDGVSSTFSGSLILNSVQLQNLGQMNSDRYALSFSYSRNHNPSSITNCAFFGGYSIAVRASNTKGLVIQNNVAMNITQGGVFIESTCTNFTVSNNLVVGLNQLASVMASSYPWVRPVAAFNILTPYGSVFSNLVAGSYDNGFMVATSMFFQTTIPNACTLTRGMSYTYNITEILYGRTFFDNEAVACRGGLFVLTMSKSESSDGSCAIVSGIKAWRSGHYGIMAVDAMANLLVAKVVLAENHIGLSLNYYRIYSDDTFSGVVASKIIGSFRDSDCADLSDSSWNKQACQAFTANDPLGLSRKGCGSVISGIYRRVGILLPMIMNGPRTCTTAGRFAVCEPPNTPDRLCGMPWEHRYGLPIDFMYSEMHIHDTIFAGFKNSSCKSYNSPAIAFNPTQIDEQSTIVTSGLTWNKMSSIAKFGTTGDCSSTLGNDGSMNSVGQSCMGQVLVLLNDLDGTMLGSGTGGQLMYNNPQYAAPYPFCIAASEFGPGFISCPTELADGSIGVPFRQYSGHWLDYSDQVLGPIINFRYFTAQNETRSYAAYGPIDDMCPLKMYFSRFPFLIADQQRQRLQSTGSQPTTFYLRWDAPTPSQVSVVDIFITGAQYYHVSVSPSMSGPWRLIPRIGRYPNETDIAGSNAGNPQKRTLTVTLRGGDKNRFYKFVQQPTVLISMTMAMDIYSFFTVILGMHISLTVFCNRLFFSSFVSDKFRCKCCLPPWHLSLSHQNCVSKKRKCEC
jgi:hypothetical protein